MPAHDYEIDEAEDEGIAGPPRPLLQGDRGQRTARSPASAASRSTSAASTTDGRLDLDVHPNSEHVLACDTVIFAIGQGAGAGLPSRTRAWR